MIHHHPPVDPQVLVPVPLHEPDPRDALLRPAAIVPAIDPDGASIAPPVPTPEPGAGTEDAQIDRAL